MPSFIAEGVIPAVVSLVVVAGGYLANRRLGIAGGQQILVSTLKDSVKALTDKVGLLEAEQAACKKRLADVEQSEYELTLKADKLISEINRLRSRTRSQREREGSQ